MRIYFYRHLPTINNLNSTFIGRLDLKCDSVFIDEHRTEINNTMGKHSFKQIFCSPLQRTKQSADLFFPGATVIIDRRLIERDLGEWKNVPKQEVRSKFPDAFFPNGNLNFNFTPPGGEQFADVLKRVSSFLLDLNDNYDIDDEIAVVTHNGIITAVKCLINGTTSTEQIEFQPFLKEYIIELSAPFLKKLGTYFSSFK